MVISSPRSFLSGQDGLGRAVALTSDTSTERQLKSTGDSYPDKDEQPRGKDGFWGAGEGAGTVSLGSRKHFLLKL